MKSPGNKLLFLLIAVLLFSNLTLLGFVFWGNRKEKKYPERGKSFSDFFEKQLGFTNDQVEKFHKLRDEHFERIRPYLKEVRAAKDSLFMLMQRSDVPDSLVEKAADKLAEKEKAQELQGFHHFKQVRELCNGEQKIKFDSLMIRIINHSFGRPSPHADEKKTGK